VQSPADLFGKHRSSGSYINLNGHSDWRTLSVILLLYATPKNPARELRCFRQGWPESDADVRRDSFVSTSDWWPEPPAKDQSFFDILIYPVLHAPNAIDFLDGMLLKDAFWQFVLNDPEVQFLSIKAIKTNRDLERVYRDGWCNPNGSLEWPVEFVHGSLAGGRSPNSPIDFLAGPRPEEVQRAADVVCVRYSALLTPLRQGNLEAAGDPVRSRGTDRILSSIWWHPAYFLDVRNGDILQTNDAGPTGLHDMGVKRWRAVMLKRSQRPDLFHGKPLVSDLVLAPTLEPHQVLKPSGKAIRRVETTTTSKRDCREWLLELMRASRNNRTRTINDLWIEAQEKWPRTLSKRAFLAARTEAIGIAQAPAWGAAGAPKRRSKNSPR
jgi:hypothetical protein